MEKFCDFITDPDWWSIAVTFFAAVVAAWITWYLGKRQNELQQQQLKLQEQQNEIQKYQTKLQEQQTKQQEYEIYRNLYKQVCDVEDFARAFLYRVALTISEIFDNEKRVQEMEKVLAECKSLERDFSECTFDIELKKCGEPINVKYYYDLYSKLRFVAKLIKFYAQHKIICNADIVINPNGFDERTEQQKLISMIVGWIDAPYRQQLTSELTVYVRLLETVRNSALKDEIKRRVLPYEE